MDDPVTWLRAQIDEDERVARDAASTPRSTARMRGAYSTWVVEDWHGGDQDEPEALISQGTSRQPTALGQFTTTPIPRRHAEHIARHDPARALREVEAKRRIIDEAERYSPELEHGDNGEWALGMVLRVLALSYADRPGYREEWRP